MTVEEELSAQIKVKALEAMEMLEHKFDSGKITDREMKLGIEVLFKCMSGITGEKFVNMLSELDSEINYGEPVYETNVLYSEERDTLSIIKREYGGEKLEFRGFKKGKLAGLQAFSYEDESNGTKMAQLKLKGLIKSLLSKGFKLL